MTAIDKAHYQLLGVDINATLDDIKKAYKSQALLLHPDKNLDRPMEAKIEFQALHQAYEALKALKGQENANRCSNGNESDSDEFYTCDDYYSFAEFMRDFHSYNRPSAAKQPKWDSTYVPTETIAAINDLNNLHTNQATIRARVTNRTEVKDWSNSCGEGKVFSMDLKDDSGEIRMAGFNDSVEKFYDMILVNKVYYVSWFTVKPANKKFTSIKHDYELTFNNATQVVPCEEDTSDIPEEVTYDFVAIADIENVDEGKTIDVIGVCKSVGDCQNTIVKRTGKEVKKRELVLMDQSGKEIALTLWGIKAEEFSDGTHPIIAVKGVQVSDFRGKCLSCLRSSLFLVNPNLEQAHALRLWYDTEGSSFTTQNLSSPVPWKLAVEANKVTPNDMEKGEIFMCKVTLIAIKGDNAVYKACTMDNCNKKVVEMGNGRYRCEKCAADIPTFKARLMLQCHFADFTDDFWATCFHETGEAVLNTKTDTLSELYFDRRDEFDVLVKNALFQQYIGKFKSKMENYNNEMRKKITVLELTPINHGEYAKQLLNDIRECSS